ncbi:MAG: hypothetical protein ACXWFH_11105 [Solirubrobacterales bacterium]
MDSGANAKAVQEFMGHSKIQTTFDTYGHLLPGSHDEVRERMDAYLLDATAESVGAPVETPGDAALVSDSGTDSGAAAPGASGGRSRSGGKRCKSANKETTLRRGPFLGYYREERYVCCFFVCVR